MCFKNFFQCDKPLCKINNRRCINNIDNIMNKAYAEFARNINLDKRNLIKKTNSKSASGDIYTRNLHVSKVTCRQKHLAG